MPHLYNSTFLPESFRSYTCSCKDGWGGPNCEMRQGSCLNDNPCGDRGACDSNSLYPGFYQCLCNPGRENDVEGLDEGIFCNKTTDLCINNPCRNEGTCLMLGMLTIQWEVIRTWSILLGTTFSWSFRNLFNIMIRFGKLYYHVTWFSRHCYPPFDNGKKWQENKVAV